MIKETTMVGFVLVMVHIMISLEELEKVLLQQIWKFQNMNLLTATLLKLDNK
jgi:hypothetical protein